MRICWQALAHSQYVVHVQATNAMYFVIVGVCAPVWEEAIFRGFLLPSLGRWLPVPGAIAASAFIFATAHLQGGCLTAICIWLSASDSP